MIHYENKLCYIREITKKENIKRKYILTKLNIKNIYTKPLHHEIFERHMRQLLEEK